MAWAQLPAITERNSSSVCVNTRLPGNDRDATPMHRSPTCSGRQAIDRSPSAAVSSSG
jgi:hypothetical protein